MIFSMRSPKQRISLDEGSLFYNDFGGALHAQREGKDEILALNLKPDGWTVSDRGELIFGCSMEGKSCLVFTDPQKRTRLFQSPDKWPVYDLLCFGDRFAAALPGMLVLGNRKENGALDFQGMKTVTLGAGFSFHASEDGFLHYTKAGSCRLWRCPIRGGASEGSFSAELLLQTMFAGAFASGNHGGAKPGGLEPEQLREHLVSQAAGRGITDTGLRLYTLLDLLSRSGDLRGDTETLEALIGYDWELQYRGMTREAFPSLALLNAFMTRGEPGLLRPGNVKYKPLQKWSLQYEKGSFSRWAKPANAPDFTDIYE